MKTTSGKAGTVTYFQNLDFLRFLLAVMVLIYHIPVISYHFGLPSNGSFAFQQRGVLSVYWFFVMSGFLLSVLAKKELEKGKFSVKKFMIRRALRIWPVYYLVITIGILLYYFILPALHIPFQNNASLSTTALLSYLFLSNVLQRLYDPGGILIVTWSVSLEEQFYLVFPFWVKLFFQRRVLRVTSAFVVLLLVIAADIIWPYPVGFLEYFEIYIEFFIIGILASELFPFCKSLPLRTRNGLFYLALGLLAISLFTDLLSLFGMVYARVFSGLIAAFVILAFSASGVSVSNRLLMLGGKISYGIYMYHMIVITGLVFFTKKVCNNFAQMHQTATIILLNISAVIITYLVAYLSYITIEKYFLSKKPY